MDKDIKVTVQPIVDPSFIKNIQTTVNKVPIKIKVQIDTRAIEKFQNDFPAIKLNLDTSQISKEVQAVTTDTADVYKTLSDNLSHIGELAGSIPFASLGIQGIQGLINNQAISETSKELTGLGTEYKTVASHAEQFNSAMSQIGTNQQDKALVNGFLDVGTVVLDTVNKIGLLNTALAGLSLYATSKGVG